MHQFSSHLQNNSSYWHQELIQALRNCELFPEIEFEKTFSLISLNKRKVVLNLVGLANQPDANQLIDLQNTFKQQNIKLVHLWEDVWLTKPQQVLARIKSLLGINQRIHGRKTKIQKVTKPIADIFLNDNHLQGTVSSRYKYGLFFKEELVGLATFSALRKMNHTENYKSAELIRFAIKAGFSVTGGLSKLISAFKEDLNPNDIMTYGDRDWSTGEAYIKLGFDLVDTLRPQTFILDNHINRTLKKTENTNQKEVFNTGSLKFILKYGK